MKKKLAIIIVLLFCITIFTGCGTTDSTTDDGTSDGTVSASTGDTETAVTIEPQVIYDENNIKISLTSFGSDLNTDESVITYVGAWLVFDIENNTDTDLTVTSYYAMINGIMLTSIFYTNISAGETLNNQMMYFGHSEMITSNISTVSSVKFVLGLYDTSANFNDAAYIQLSTSAADYVQPAFVPEGETLIDDNGFQVYYLGSEYDGYSWIYHLYVANNNNEMVEMNFNDPLADGNDAFMHAFVFNGVLFPYASAFATIQLQTGDDDYTGPDEVDTLTGTLIINDYGDDDAVYASALISLSQKELIE